METTPLEKPVTDNIEKQTDTDKNYKWRVLVAIISGTFMVILDSTAVNVALPTLQKAFGTPGNPLPIDQVSGALTAYILALGIVTPMAGFLSERFGIKRMYLSSLVLFTLGSILCAFSPSLPWLIAFRALQGLGGGMIAPLGTSLLFGAFAEKERGMAFGIYGIPLVVAPASGPVLGGYFVEFLDWRYIFFINIPIGIIGVIVAFLWLKENRQGTSVRLDIAGAILSAISFGTLLYGITRGESLGWTNPEVITLLIVGLISLAIFITVELLVKDPLLNLRLFQKRSFAFANIVGWVSSIALFGAEFLVPIYLQTLRGQTPLQAGLLVLPLAIAAGFVTPLAGGLYNRIGGRWLIMIGSALLAFNTWELAHITADTPFINLMGLLAIRGVALGCILQTTLTLALTGLQPAQLPRASSLLTATRNVFQSFGIAMLSTVVANRRSFYLDTSMQDLKNPATTLAKQVAARIQELAQQGQPVATATKTVMAEIGKFIFTDAFVRSLNDAYYVTFWLSIAALLLALTLPGKAKQQQKRPASPSTEQETVAATPPVGH